MTRESARMLAQNPWVMKRLAKHMALQCFRNTRLEDFHAGITPWSPAGDYSDVIVTTPAGEICLAPALAAQRRGDEGADDRGGQPRVSVAPGSLR